MKIEKEEIQKIVLSLMLFAGVIYCYFTFLLGPLSTAQAAGEAKIHTLEPQIADAKKQLQKTADLEKKAPVSSKALEQINALIPEGAPVAWFPPRIAEFFKHEGIDKALTRLNNEFPEKELTGFRKLVWSVDIPHVEFVPLGMALAKLENQEPLLEIMNVSVEAMKEDPQYQHATLTVSTLVKQ